MRALLGLREDYAERTRIIESELAVLTQRIGFDEAQARAIERSVCELRTAMDGVTAGDAQARAATHSISELHATIDDITENVVHIDKLRRETAYMWTHIDQVVADVEELQRDMAQAPPAPEPLCPPRPPQLEAGAPNLGFLTDSDIGRASHATRLTWDALRSAFDPPP